MNSWNQKTIEKSKVLIVGAGALGNEVVKNLVLAGLGKIYIIDYDNVVMANLNRCAFFNIEDARLKRPKTEALYRNMENIKINKETEIIAINEDLMKMSGEEECFKDAILYVSCLDNIAARLKLNIISLTNNKPLVDGGMEGWEGYVRVTIPGKTACIECNTDTTSKSIEERMSCSGRMIDDKLVLPLASLPSTTSIIGGLQAQEVFKLLLDPEGKKLKNLAGKILYYMGGVNYLSLVEVAKRKDCLCSNIY